MAITETMTQKVGMFTPTQLRILQVLSDGLQHTRAELIACLCDDLCGKGVVATHLTYLRAKLRPMGQDVVCEAVGRSVKYRHVRLLHSSNDGKR